MPIQRGPDLTEQILRGFSVGSGIAIAKERNRIARQTQEDLERAREFQRDVTILGLQRTDIPRGSPVGLGIPETSAYATQLRKVFNKYGDLGLEPGAIDQMGLIVNEITENDVWTSFRNEWEKERLKLYGGLSPEEQRKAMFGETSLGFAAGEQENVARISGAVFVDMMNKIKRGQLEQLTPDQLQFISFPDLGTDTQFTAMQQQALAEIKKAGLEGQLADMTREGLGAVSPEDVAAARGFAPGTAQRVEAQNTAEFIRANLSANVDNFGIVAFNELKSEIAQDDALSLYTYALNKYLPNAVRDPATGEVRANPYEANLFAGYLSPDQLEKQATDEYLKENFRSIPPQMRATLIDWSMNGVPAEDGARVPLFSAEGQQILQARAPQLMDAARALAGVWTTAEEFQNSILNQMGEGGRTILYQIDRGIDFVENFPPEDRARMLEEYTKATSTLYGEDAARYIRKGILKGRGEFQFGDMEGNLLPGSERVNFKIQELAKIHNDGEMDLSKGSAFVDAFRKVFNRPPTGSEATLFRSLIQEGGK